MEDEDGDVGCCLFRIGTHIHTYTNPCLCDMIKTTNIQDALVPQGNVEESAPRLQRHKYADYDHRN
jgi:hypothetical protein